MADNIPDKTVYQANRRYMAWAALALMIVSTIVILLFPDRFTKVDSILMMMYGSLSGLVAAYFGFANMVKKTPPK